MNAPTTPRRPCLELWSRVLRDPQLQDLPFKVETNEYGQLVLSPHKIRHGIQQGRIADLLRDHNPQPGRRAVEFAVATPAGVKVPDVVWISEERWATVPEDADVSPIAPELVVEVLSGSNTKAHIEAKRRLYFESGAREVWTCDPEGRMTFYNASGELPASALVPSFPACIS